MGHPRFVNSTCIHPTPFIPVYICRCDVLCIYFIVRPCISINFIPFICFVCLFASIRLIIKEIRFNRSRTFFYPPASLSASATRS